MRRPILPASLRTKNKPIAEPVTPAAKQYVCPTTSLPYHNSCPVTACPANVAHLGRESGCAYNFLGGKRELTVMDLSYVFAVDLKLAKKHVEEGERAIQHALLVHKLLSQVRENNEVRHTCPRCGVLRTTVGECLMRKQCDERQSVVMPLLNRPPFNLPELRITSTDVFILLHNRRKINQFLKSLDQPGRKLRFRSLFGLSPDTFASLRTLRTLV